MRYANTELQDRLAAGYVLGTLRGRARARFVSLLKYNPDLRLRVLAWEQRIAPMALAAPDVAPPPRLWPRIVKRINASRTRRAETRLFGWRVLAGLGVSVALVLALYVGGNPAEPPVEMVAVMTDAQGQASMVVTWPEQHRLREPQIKLRIVQDHPAMATGAARELWLLPKDPQSPPRSLGMIGTDRDQIIRIAADAAGIIDNAWGLALSVEPAGGSPTGTPTGPMLFKGRCIKII